MYKFFSSTIGRAKTSSLSYKMLLLHELLEVADADLWAGGGV